jgi:hypothetical protein
MAKITRIGVPVLVAQDYLRATAQAPPDGNPYSDLPILNSGILHTEHIAPYARALGLSGAQARQLEEELTTPYCQPDHVVSSD